MAATLRTVRGEKRDDGGEEHEEEGWPAQEPGTDPLDRFSAKSSGSLPRLRR
jgi:hypothetical protein